MIADEPIIPMNPVVMRNGCQEKNLHPAPVGKVAAKYPKIAEKAMKAATSLFFFASVIGGPAIVSFCCR